MIKELLGDQVDVTESGRYIAEVVYGANDGIVTTFAVVSGVAGAALDPGIVLVLGAANLFADGFSMGMSNYLSRRSEMDYESASQSGGAGADSRDDDGDPVSAAGDGEGGSHKSPARTAAATFAAFVVAGWTPLVPYILGIRPLFEFSVLFTGLAFFGVGAGRSLVTDRPWYRNGTEMLVVGMLAAGVAFGVGHLLGGVA